MDIESLPATGSQEATAGSDPVGRAALLKRVAIALGGITAGGAAAAGLANASRKHDTHGSHNASGLTSRDKEILAFALRLEHLQTAFYQEAIHRGKLTGEVKQFAHIVGGEEHAHLAYLEGVLGGGTGTKDKGSYSFGDATGSDKAFIKAAAKIEDTGLAAYNGQAGNLSSTALQNVARVISVEARHAAWARSLAGQNPAPVPADKPISAAQALNAIKPYMA